MSIIKINIKERPFVCLSKDCLECSDLSWGARGLHAFLISKPSNWQIKISYLVKSSPQGKDAIYKLINELVDGGYIERIQERDPATQKFKGYNYIVYEEPQQKQIKDVVSGNSGNGLDTMNKNEKGTTQICELYSKHPQQDYPDTENPTLINNKINNNKLNKNKAAAKEMNIDPDIAAALSLSDIDFTIGEELSERQVDYLNHILSQKYWVLKEKIAFEQVNFEDLARAIRLELTNKNSYKKSNQQFIYKVNIILAEAIKETWSPTNAMAETNQWNDTVIREQLKILADEIQGLFRERAGFISDLSAAKARVPADSILIKSYQINIEKYDHQLQTLMERHQQLLNQLSTKAASHYGKKQQEKANV